MTKSEALAVKNVAFYSYRMPFPTQLEKNRSRKIEDNFQLYLGNFGVVLRYFRTWQERRYQLEVIQNVAGMISRIFADLMFTENADVKNESPDVQKAIDDFFFRNNFHNVLHESAITQSYAGKTYFETYLKDGLVQIAELNPANVYPQYSSLYAQGVPNAVVISWEPKIGDQLTRFIKTHTPGLITYELRKLSIGGDDLGPLPLAMLDPTLPEMEDTGLDYIPVYSVNNVKTGRQVDGVSDYDDLRTLFEELTRAQSQIATQLKKHADAKMAVPPGVLNEHGKVMNGDLEMFEVSSEKGEIVPQFITNSNPLIDQAFKQTEKIIEAIARISEVSTVLIDWNVSGGTERVGALRLRLLRTLSKVKRKLRPYEKTIKDIVIDALEWEGSATLEHTDINVQFGDGLPKDMLEEAQLQTLLVNNNLQSEDDALRALYDIDGDLLDQKKKEIADDSTKRMSTAMATIPTFSMGNENNPV